MSKFITFTCPQELGTGCVQPCGQAAKDGAVCGSTQCAQGLGGANRDFL